MTATLQPTATILSTVTAVATQIVPAAGPGTNTIILLTLTDLQAADRLGIQPEITGVLLTPTHGQFDVRANLAGNQVLEVRATGKITSRPSLTRSMAPLLTFSQPVSATDAAELELAIRLIAA